jgi:putative salt-induced outer membrane protein YdiY
VKLALLFAALPLAAQTPTFTAPTPAQGNTPPPLWTDKTGPGAVFLAAPLPQDPATSSAPAAPAKAWSDKASLSYVSVGGNAQSQSLGFANEYKVVSGDTSFQFNLAGVRVSTGTVSRSATGATLDQAVVVETRTNTTTTEAYMGLLRLDQKITERFFWFGAASWDRNRPAGLDNRYKGVVGVGTLWVNDDRTKFRTDYGVGYTKEDPLFKTPGYQDSFATWQLGSKLEQKVYLSSVFASELAVSGSLRESRDWFGSWKNSFTTNISARLALKVGYDLNYRNVPNKVGVDVVQTPVATPPVVLGQVPFALKRLDTVFSTSLVLTF